MVHQSLDNIFKKNRSKSTKTSLFSWILITFAFSYAINAEQMLVYYDIWVRYYGQKDT